MGEIPEAGEGHGDEYSARRFGLVVPSRIRLGAYEIDELLGRDKVSLDIFWLKDESLEDSANLPDPDVIAAEIAEDLRAALEQFEAIQADLARR